MCQLHTVTQVVLGESGKGIKGGGDTGANCWSDAKLLIMSALEALFATMRYIN